MPPVAGMQNRSKKNTALEKVIHTRSSSTAARRRWVIAQSDDRAAELAKSLRISPITAQVLLNRDICDTATANIFLRPKLTELIAPEQMPGIDSAVARIRKAVETNEKITIYGDYDVDGITAVSILWQMLTLLDAQVDFYIPHRIDEGYGLNEEAIQSIAKSGTRLLITVDCGITAVHSAQIAKDAGMDLVITDHHQPGDELPQACAIVHPAIDNAYANPDSSGSMVAFKLAWAIANDFSSGSKMQPRLRDFMLNATSLAAMGTIADVMDLRAENRVLTSYGLKSLPQSSLCGIAALIEIAELTGRGLDSFHIGFQLAPMLNVAGRMGHARLAVELLTTDSEIRSRQIAEYLKQQNTQRQQAERKILKHACKMIVEQGLNHPDRRSIVLADENWHNGVIGIVASRIVDRFYRPTIMLNITDGVAVGSGRSVPGFHLLDAISACSDHLIQFGGHKMAAGVTLEHNKIDDFCRAFEEFAQNYPEPVDTEEKLQIETLTPLKTFNRGLVDELALLEPFGQGNPKPIFATCGVRVASPPRRVGARSDHLQLVITDNTATIRCIGFGMGKLEKKLLETDYFDVAYEPQLNHYNGNTTVEFNLRDIQFE